MVYTVRFSSSKCSLFHNSNIFGSCIIHILCTGCAKIKKNNSGSKRLNVVFRSIQTFRHIKTHPAVPQGKLYERGDLTRQHSVIQEQFTVSYLWCKSLKFYGPYHQETCQLPYKKSVFAGEGKNHLFTTHKDKSFLTTVIKAKYSCVYSLSIGASGLT